MDDFKIMGTTLLECETALQHLDRFLYAHGLTRSEPKTKSYGDRRSAIAALKDPTLASLARDSRCGSPGGIEALCSLLERLVRERSLTPHSYRFILNNLRHHRDPGAALMLATSREIANTDPVATGDYLLDVPLSSAVRDLLFEQLLSCPDDSTDALDLHVLRVFAKRRGDLLGSAEGKVFESLAESAARRAPIRGWAAMALGHTDRWRQEYMMSSIDSEADPWVRRIMFATLKRVNRGRTRDRFLGHMREKSPDLRYTAEWLDAA
jgi:hypothetical protein